MGTFYKMSKLSSKLMGMRFMQRALERSQAKLQDAEQADRRQGEASELATDDVSNVG